MSCEKGHALVYGYLAGVYGLFCCNAGCTYFQPMEEK